MGEPDQKKTRKVNERPTYQKVILWPFFLLLQLWCMTIRFRFEGDSQELFKSSDKPYLLIGWHNVLFSIPLLIRRYRRHRKICGLVSASKDGAWLAAIFELIGFEAVRGSANFRGAQSLKELIRITRMGLDIGITPDGSKGPAYVLKPGAAALAKVSKMGIMLVGCEFHNAWRLNSWDRFFVPKPFSVMTIRVERINDFSELGESDPYRASLILQKKLMQLQPVDPLIPDPAVKIDSLANAENSE